VEPLGPVEGLDVNAFAGAYAGRRVLVTGHTGFKGSWLTLWLSTLGAQVTGVALPPQGAPNHWDLLDLPVDSHFVDIRDAAALAAVVTRAAPDIVFHLAAQPLVRRSYRDPLGTWSTNVMGTVNLLEALRHAPGVRAMVVVTTDKCYRNNEWPWGYRETDALGGHDAYSASKAATELAVDSYRQAFYPDAGPLVATARAGNVIGGGDWSEDRLVPDLVRAAASDRPMEIRSPAATRPWQHVLESLSGYLMLGQRLLAGEVQAAQAWNFGPTQEGNCKVSEVLAALAQYWPRLTWQVSTSPQPHEAQLLYLDSAKARSALGWSPVWDLQHALRHTAHWYRAFHEGGHVTSLEQLHAYVEDAARADTAWAAS
jgi:CDP-glucose 4,6-dehydratase